MIVLLLYLLFSVQNSAGLNITEKLNSEILQNYSDFFNFGVKRATLDKSKIENAIIKSKIDVLGDVFKRNIEVIKAHDCLDLVFLIDASSSVGEDNFRSEINFVKKVLSDVTVEYSHSRIAVVTFSSSNSIIVHIDELSNPREENNKCLLLNKQFHNISYSGGSTHTAKAFEKAQEILKNSRSESTKVIFLITDGFSNGGDPIPIANSLKKQQVVIFTIGIQSGNYKELYSLSTSPGEFYSYLLDSFQEFEGLARRALHVDLKSGDYIPLGTSKPCDSLCPNNNCCDAKAVCTCGTTTGQYSCVCQLGYYGSGLTNSCAPCPSGTYADGPNACLPCPDAQHITTPPAISIHDCLCKSGYQSTTDNKCEVIKCNLLEEPENGYFVKKKNCSNVLNSACGVRCKVGYTLTGSSIRLCQNSSKWSGIPPSCQVKTCDSLLSPPNGNMSCKHPDLDVLYEENSPLPVDTICSFTCETGRLLIGSKHRTCLPLAQWDGLRTSCRQVKCNKLYKIPFGTISPSSCLAGKQIYGQICNVTCLEGFELKGLPQRVCTGKSSTWNDHQSVICKDVSSPNLTCPETIQLKTIKGKHFAYTTWEIPTVTDNSGQNVTVWTKPAINNITNFKFKVGSTNVTYFAVDVFNNRAKCTFQVIVTDKEIPVIENCISPPIFLASADKNGANVTWDEPVIYDNTAKDKLKIEKSHEFGFFQIGTTNVIYTVVDSSNNTNSCTLNITVEENKCELSPTIHGNNKCQSRNNSMQCVVTCEEGYAIPITSSFETEVDNSSASVQFNCNNNNPYWFSNEGEGFPECSVTEVPLDILQKGELILDVPEACNDTNKINDLENEIKTTISTNIKDDCIGATCKLLNVNSECFEDEELQEAEEEHTNIIKRDLVEQAKLKKVVGKKAQRRKKLRIKFQVHAKNRKNKKNSKITNLGKKLRNIQYLDGRNISVVVRFEKPSVNCALGSIPRKLLCVQCPQGTFHNISAKICQSCAIGFFNSKFGRTTCLSCPVNFSTRRIHAKSIDNCLEQCPPGTFGHKKQIKNSKHSPNAVIERVTLKPFCTSCPFGSYQMKFGQTGCLDCLEGFTTETRGAVNRKYCQAIPVENCNVTNVCNSGKCVEENGYFTCQCFEGFIGTYCVEKIKFCTSNPCQNNGKCIETSKGFSCECLEGFSGIYCNIFKDLCDLTCQNGGYCVQLEEGEKVCVCEEGFYGELCQDKINYCNNTENICENGGKCQETLNQYSCSCLQGFIGRRCTILPCDYQPCSKNAVCSNILEDNATINSYNCECISGYEGPDCTNLINYCKSNFCKNEAVCINLETSYSCECKTQFYGKHCELETSVNYTLNFPRSGITDYVELEGFKEDLSEISLCFWIKTSDSTNYGTIISYATEEFDNAFTLTDYTGLVLYINGHNIVTDVFLNNGLWHHFCVTWSSLDGSYNIFLNGKSVKNGENFARKQIIKGKGKLIIGQEQDILGGRFSQSESFVGRLSNLDLWGKVLSEPEITAIMNSCDFYLHGDLYSWGQVQLFIKGDIQIENSTFCNQCEDPEIVYNGIVDVIDNKAFYKCFTGYVLNEPVYLQGRLCLKSGKWEGEIIPICRPVYCGYPGYFKNGYFRAENYYFNNNVSYFCYDGYNLTGSSTRICSENEKWIPEEPSCLGIQCEILPKPQNGEFKLLTEISEEYPEGEFNNYEPGIQLELLCNNASNLVGNKVVSCEENGLWDLTIGFCELAPTPKPKLACSLDLIPKPPDFGYTVLESLNAVIEGESDSIAYKCRPGFKLIGENKTVCILDGYWSEIDMKCQPVTCGKPPRFLLMNIGLEGNIKEYYAGNMASYQCLAGYRLFGNGNIRCVLNGRWTRMQGKCIKNSCYKPNVVEEAEIIGKSYLFQEKLLIKCSSESVSIICASSGKWIRENQADGDLLDSKCWRK